MPKFRVLSPIKVGDETVTEGEVELSAKHAAAALARGELEAVREAKPAKDDKSEAGKTGAAK